MEVPASVGAPVRPVGSAAGFTRTAQENAPSEAAYRHAGGAGKYRICRASTGVVVGPEPAP